MSDDRTWTAPGAAEPTRDASAPSRPEPAPPPVDGTRAAPPAYGPPAAPPAYGPPAAPTPYGPPSAVPATRPQPGAPTSANGPPHAAPPAYRPPSAAPPAYGPPLASTPFSATPAPAPTGGFAPQGFGAPPGHPPGTPGWTPPPRPGLIPLAPISFGTTLGAPFRAFRRNPRPTFGVSLLLQGAVLLVGLLVIGLVAWATFSRVGFASSSAEEDEIAAGATGLTLLAAVVPFVLSLLASGVMQGVISLEIARQTLGERLRFPQLWRMARGRLWAVGGWVLAVTVVTMIALALGVLLIIVPFALGGAGTGVGVLLVLILGLGGLVLAAWLVTKLAFVPSAIVLERARITVAVGRSWRLTRGAFWRTFGTLLLVYAIFQFASGLVTQVPVYAGAIVATVVDPTGQDIGALIAVLGGAYLIAILLSVLFGAIAVVVQSGTATLLYLDRRIRVEGLDLELQQYVEARADGRAPDEDPYQAAADRAARRP